jgi:predicted dehydrogenase
MHKGKVRLAVLGAGFIGKVHLDKFGKLSDVSLAGVYDPITDLARQAAAKAGVEKVYESADAVFESKDIDAVVLAVPNKLHAVMAVKALEMGKHVLLEKPMAIDVTQAADIVKAARRSGLTLMIAHQMRWNWSTRQVQERVQKGELGKIYFAKAVYLRRNGIPGWGSWFTRMNESGGGPLIDIGVHVLDLVLGLMGSPKPVSVVGSTFAEFGPRKLGLGTWGTPDPSGYFDVEDLASAFIKLDGGASVTLDVSWAANMEARNEVQILGTDGGAAVRDNGGAYFGQSFGSTFDIPIPPQPQDYDARVELSRHFIECVKNEKKPICNEETGFAVNSVIDAIYRSSKSGKAVDIDLSVLSGSSSDRTRKTR